MAGANLRVGANNTEFNSAMRDMANEMKVIKSEFNLAQTQAKLFGNETDMLKAKENELTSTLRVQNNMLKLQETQYNSLTENSNKLKLEHEQLALKVQEATEKYKQSVEQTGKNSEESKKLKSELDQLSVSYVKVDKALTVNNNKLATATQKFNTTKVAILENTSALEDLQNKINNVGMEKLEQEEVKVDKETERLNRQLERLKAQLGGELPPATEQAFIQMQKLNGEIRSAGREYGRHSVEVMNARNKLSEFALGLDDTTFKQIYMKAQLGLTNGQLNQQANAIKLNARMVSLMGSQTEILTERMKGLQEHGIKPEHFKTASTIGQFQMLNETMAAGNKSISNLSLAYRTMGANVEKTIKNFSMQKVAMRESQGNMVAYGLLMRGMGATMASMTLAFPIAGIAAALFYNKLFSSAIEADEGLKAMVDTLKGQLAEAFKPLVAVAGEFLKAIIPIISKVAEMVINFNNAHPTLAKILAVIGFLAPAMTLLLMPLSLGVGLFSGWGIVLNTLWTAIGGVVTVIGTASATFLAFAGIGAVVVGAFILMYTKCEWFRNGVNALGNWLKNFFTVTIPQAFNSMIQWFKELPSKVSEMWNDFKNACSNGLSKVSNFFTVTIPQTFNMVIDFFKNNWKEILLFIVNPFAGAFALAYKHCDGFREKVNSFIIAVKTTFINGWNTIAMFFTSTMPIFFTNLWTTIKQSFVMGWNAVVTFFTVSIPQWINNMVQWFLQLPNRIAFALGQLVGIMATWGVSIWTYLSTNVPIWINSVVTWFGELPGKIKTWFDNIISDIISWGINTYTEISTTVAKIITDVVTWFSELPGKIKIWFDKIISDIVTWGINTYTEISTTITKIITDVVTWFSELPGKIKAWFDKIISDITTWGVNTYTEISKSVTKMINDVVKWFSEMPGKIWTWLVNCVTNITTWGTNMLTEAKSGMQKVFDGIVDTFKNLPSKMMDIGKNIVAGIKQGIKDAWDSMTSWIGGLCDSFTKGVKDKFEIHSPSHIFRDEVGAMLAQGIGVGFEQEMPGINTDVRKTLNTTIDVAKVSGLRNIDKMYSNTRNNSSITRAVVNEILEKMDRLEKALDIKVDGKSIVYATVDDMSEALAFKSGRESFA